MRKKKIETRTWILKATVEESEIVRVRRRHPVTTMRCEHCGHESRSEAYTEEIRHLPIGVTKTDK